MQITIVAGARPNFMKIAPIIHEFIRVNAVKKMFSFRLIHTGQHYDSKMSDTFFKELDIPHPDKNLECGGGSQAEQTAAIMIAFEKELINNPTDLVIVVGDVTSTMACSIVAKKMNTRVAHVEAGIRSFDTAMPEEINRMVTDSITDYFFTTSETANENLINAGIPVERIFFVGNVMIDTLLKNENSFIKPTFFDEWGIKEKSYFIMTLHRPANVDDPQILSALITEVIKNANGLPVVFPMHPRTAKLFHSLDLNFPNLFVTEPMGYLEFNYLVKYAVGVITDSGGITEETTVMGVPCITLRNSTERPETCTIGTNELIGTDSSNIAPNLKKILANNWKSGSIPPLWDGKAAERIVFHLSELNNG